MKIIRTKPVLMAALGSCEKAWSAEGMQGLLREVQVRLLEVRVKFPLLEFAARHLARLLPAEEHLPFCKGIAAQGTEGGNVLIGILLQEGLEKRYTGSLQQAAVFIAQGNAWYVCDIIGERVWGVALLRYPEKTLPALQELSRHPSELVARSLGAGIHYAVKKGLPATEVRTVFKLLLSLRGSKNQQVKQGIGWAAKTCARFHPEIITHFRKELEAAETPAWFRKKIQIGLERNSYATREKSTIDTE
ncbi:MAG: DNA alkylation repair protein [Bacteroidia bacterium]|nr:DNA alkylation repair protein [Bacteroidia bacterium]